MQPRVPALAILLAIAIQGCATSRGVLDVRVPAVAEPSEGRVVKVTKVTDVRNFMRDPHEPSIPSLMQGEIYDPAITKRAIARKRNTFGKALGDILLPEGRSVTQLVKESLISALRRAGYQVVEPGDPRSVKALPIEADVRQFWSWMNPGFSKIKLNFAATVLVRDAGSANARALKVSAAHVLKSPTADTEAWTEIIQGGLQNLSYNLARVLKPRASAATASAATEAPPDELEATTTNQAEISAAPAVQSSGGAAEQAALTTSTQ